MSPNHNRMPVILAEEDWATWLGEERATGDELKHMIAEPCGRPVEPPRPLRLSFAVQVHGDLKRHPVALGESVETGAVDRRDVGEDAPVSVVWRDETVALHLVDARGEPRRRSIVQALMGSSYEKPRRGMCRRGSAHVAVSRASKGRSAVIAPMGLFQPATKRSPAEAEPSSSTTSQQRDKRQRHRQGAAPISPLCA